MSLTIVVGTGRCGSTMLSRMLHMHPEVLSLSEFWNVFIEHEGIIPTHDMSGAEYWQRIANPARTAYDGLVLAGIITNDVHYPYHGRFEAADMPSIMHVLIPIADDPDSLFDTLTTQVSAWPRRSVAEHCSALFAELADRLGRRVIIERTGGALGYLPLLREQFPDARFVYLYRNGPDSALSMSRYPPYRLAVLNAIAEAVGGSPQPELQSLLETLPDQIKSAGPEDFKGVTEPPFDKARFQAFPVPMTYFAWLWSDEIRTGTGEIRKLRRDAWTTLRYEHLVKDTRAELAKLAGFVGVSEDKRWLDEACAFLDPGRPKSAASRFHPVELAELRAACAAGTRAFELLESEQAALANDDVGVVMSTDQPEHRLAIVGAGVMGTNITTLAVGHGVPVVLVDINEDVLAQARKTISQKLRHAQLLGSLPGLPHGKLVTSVSLDDVADATTVIEAVIEVPETKAKVLTGVSAVVRPGTLLISNTSCIPIDEMAASVARPEELVGVHFMNPSYMIKMVEVIRGPRTSDATLEKVTALLTALGRQALVINDSPGFVINRLLHPLINSAAMLVEEGIASVEVVDGLLEGCLGHSTGPLRTADLIGIDNLVDSLNVLYERRQDESCRPCALMLEKVREGDLGRKTGRGFYDYGKVAS